MICASTKSLLPISIERNHGNECNNSPNRTNDCHHGKIKRQTVQGVAVIVVGQIRVVDVFIYCKRFRKQGFGAVEGELKVPKPHQIPRYHLVDANPIPAKTCAKQANDNGNQSRIFSLKTRKRSANQEYTDEATWTSYLPSRSWKQYWKGHKHHKT